MVTVARVTKPPRHNFLPPRDDEWKAHGNCVTRKVDPRVFDGVQVSKYGAIDYSAAVAVCEGCPVRGFCLEDAIVNDETDCVRGGLTPEEYRAIGKKPRHRHKRPGEKGYKTKQAAA